MKKTTKPKVQPVLTYEERIQQAYKNKLSHCWGDVKKVPVPENRKLKVGDEVQVGNLDDCIVAWISDDQQYVVIDYTSVENNYGKPIINEHQIGCWDWRDVYLLYDIINTELFPRNNNSRNTYQNIQLGSLVNKVLSYGADDAPEYQRDYVWTNKDEINLINSIINGSDIGKFIFLKYKWPKVDAEVLDGKQRLNTLIRFITSQFKVNGLYWHEWSRFDRQRFGDHVVQYAELDAENFTEADKLRIFLQVNAAGVPQSEEHLTKIKTRLQELENE